MWSVTPLQRFQRKYVVSPTGCWEWTGCRDGLANPDNPRGKYGRFALDGCHMIPAHRAAYTLLRGRIPDGLHVCHTCDNPGCVNPAHLFLGTRQDNSDDKLAKGRAWHQKPGTRPPRLGTGKGRFVLGRGTVVDVTCVVCGAATVQRTASIRLGFNAACSQKCKGVLTGARTRTGAEVPCAECGAFVWKTPYQLKKYAHAYCSSRCNGIANARRLHGA